jgi:molybdenum-dependent DNA-binding transcriptional regulator ModE
MGLPNPDEKKATPTGSCNVPAGTRNGKENAHGGTTLTPIARTLLEEFRETERLVQNTISRREIARVEVVQNPKHSLS